jgi:hypothetical protein
MSKLVRLTTLGIKQEQMQNTPVARTATDYLHAEDVNIVPFVAMEQQNYYRTTLDRVKMIPGKKKYQITFKTPLKGSGTAGVKYTPLVSALEACQLSSTTHSGQEAVGSAIPGRNNIGVSPSPVIGLVTPGFSLQSGIIEITLVSTTLTSPEGAVFNGIFYPADITDNVIVGSATISDTAFANVAFDGNLTGLKLTVDDPDANGVGDPVSTWKVGDRWTFRYTSAEQVDVELVASNSASKSVTIEVNYNGLKHVAAGCLGKVKCTMSASKTAMLEFSFEGLYAEAEDDNLPTTTPNTIDPAIFENSQLLLDNEAAISVASKVEWDDGGDLQEIPDTRSASGLYGFELVGRDPKGSIDPLLVPVSDYNLMNKMMTGDEVTLAFQFGSVAGNIVTFSFPMTQFDAYKYGDRNKMRTAEIPLLFNGDEATPWMTMTFR